MRDLWSVSGTVSAETAAKPVPRRCRTGRLAGASLCSKTSETSAGTVSGLLERRSCDIEADIPVQAISTVTPTPHCLLA